MNWGTFLDFLESRRAYSALGLCQHAKVVREANSEVVVEVPEHGDLVEIAEYEGQRLAIESLLSEFAGAPTTIVFERGD